MEALLGTVGGWLQPLVELVEWASISLIQYTTVIGAIVYALLTGFVIATVRWFFFNLTAAFTVLNLSAGAYVLATPDDLRWARRGSRLPDVDRVQELAETFFVWAGIGACVAVIFLLLVLFRSVKFTEIRKKELKELKRKASYYNDAAETMVRLPD